MNRSLFLTGWLTIAALAAMAQQPDTAQVLVHYKFSHLRDTSDRAHPYTENMVLMIGNHSGVYRSYDRQLSEALDKKKMQDAIAGSGGGPVRVERHMSGSGERYYQYPNDNKLLHQKPLIMFNFLIPETLPVIDWQIAADTASYGGLHCQKATTHFKGRDYTAWFCPDLPTRVGPWKLTGLPGVIVEAYDAKKEVLFTFDGFEKAVPTVKKNEQPGAGNPGDPGHRPGLPGMEDADEDPNLITPSPKAIKSTEKEFAKLQQAAEKDPNSVAQALMAAQGGGPAGGDGPKIKMDMVRMRPGPVLNNPIELPEKQ
jgi:GLPGLI family protein